MSNYKQSSVDWLINEHFGGIENCTPDFKRKIEQAKAMHKEEIEKTAIKCHFEGTRQKGKNSEEYIEYGKKYYNETFGGNK